MRMTSPRNILEFDVVVIGGGGAGLSGALTLARARRSVLVVDGGEPRNAPAPAVHGFLSRDGINPAELLATGRTEIASYGAEILNRQVVSTGRTEDGFVVTLDDGSLISARRLLVTTGVVDELPEVEGVRERWGRDVLHCPYCHGWEVQDQPIGVLGTGPWAMHHALLFRQWTEDLTLFLHTAPQLTAGEEEQLAARGVRVVEGEVASLDIVGDQLAGVRLRSGEVVPRRALVVAPRFKPGAAILAGLGLEPAAHPSGLGDHIVVDATGQTAVAGVWAAGNVTDPFAQVINAAAAAAWAAAHINADLIAEETRVAVGAYGDRVPAA